ncbi:MAG: SpoIIE family protein phosphatase, partial [Patescibacteria group bacterium]|nr:SpoIIE family protein phosphatase [Patescibacteria group bacterium]
NIDKDKALTRKELTFKFERQADSAKAAQDKKDAIAAADSRKQKIISASVSGGLLLAIAFGIFVFRSLKVTRKQKSLIERQKGLVEEQKQQVEQQKAIVEEKNKDILDSITYAKRLQDAILPPLSIVRKYFPESFVLYKPKDIVAGDFYWMEKEGDTILIAACDCTGHGVPGAMVSVVCSNALNRALKEFNIKDTGKLLDKVRELVLETFEKSGGEVKDGMDCSFCAINTKTKEVEWSGAYNPLWYITASPNPSEGGAYELVEITADKQPIGKTDNPKPFTTHTITISPQSGGQRGASIYLFTDGYADQFGGPKGKKFKYKQLQELLAANANKPMEEQGKILNETI